MLDSENTLFLLSDDPSSSGVLSCYVDISDVFDTGPTFNWCDNQAILSQLDENKGYVKCAVILDVNLLRYFTKNMFEYIISRIQLERDVNLDAIFHLLEQIKLLSLYLIGKFEDYKDFLSNTSEGNIKNIHVLFDLLCLYKSSSRVLNNDKINNIKKLLYFIMYFMNDAFFYTALNSYVQHNIDKPANPSLENDENMMRNKKIYYALKYVIYKAEENIFYSDYQPYYIFPKEKDDKTQLIFINTLFLVYDCSFDGDVNVLILKSLMKIPGFFHKNISIKLIESLAKLKPGRDSSLKNIKLQIFLLIHVYPKLNVKFYQSCLKHLMPILLNCQQLYLIGECRDMIPDAVVNQIKYWIIDAYKRYAIGLLLVAGDDPEQLKELYQYMYECFTLLHSREVDSMFDLELISFFLNMNLEFTKTAQSKAYVKANPSAFKIILDDLIKTIYHCQQHYLSLDNSVQAKEAIRRVREEMFAAFDRYANVLFLGCQGDQDIIKTQYLAIAHCIMTLFSREVDCLFKLQLINYYHILVTQVPLPFNADFLVSMNDFTVGIEVDNTSDVEISGQHHGEVDGQKQKLISDIWVMREQLFSQRSSYSGPGMLT